MFTALRRKVAIAMAPVLVAAGAVAALALGGPAAGASEGFYEPPSPLPAGTHGDLIRSEPVSYVDGKAQATRIMYLSQDKDGRPIAVTGMVLVPDKPWTGSGPRPLVAYGSATVGLGDECVLSKTMAGEGRPDLLSNARGVFVNPLLDKGLAVVEVDYEGMGTPGDPTFMMRLPQAHTVLDALRAAQRLPGTGLPADGPVGVSGYSQGGAASAAAAELAATYTPELDLKGVYVGAAPTELAAMLRQDDGGYAAAVLLFAVVGADAAYPELHVADLFNAKGRRILDSIRDRCTMEATLPNLFLNTRDLTADGRPLADVLQRDPYRRIADEQRVGSVAPRVPVLIQHPLVDDLVPYSVGRKLSDDWCARGATVEFRTMNTFPFLLGSHLAGTPAAAADSVAWLSDRFNGKPPVKTCGPWGL
ncbi:alpha/beta fold hydrolase [Streptomyces sp. B1866]|uniref:lipase family protein n=1 Tax=Streptomyces sp. B1866 TaxID=3075431 RepID=UPI002890F630|nr:lipase family protein [Streptomyces sp. B1866]MDT3397337.1 alpha/beta fold hydrolase [Streptomyces sp. B1866]